MRFAELVNHWIFERKWRSWAILRACLFECPQGIIYTDHNFALFHLTLCFVVGSSWWVRPCGPNSSCVVTWNIVRRRNVLVDFLICWALSAKGSFYLLVSRHRRVQARYVCLWGSCRSMRLFQISLRGVSNIQYKSVFKWHLWLSYLKSYCLDVVLRISGWYGSLTKSRTYGNLSTLTPKAHSFVVKSAWPKVHNLFQNSHLYTFTLKGYMLLTTSRLGTSVPGHSSPEQLPTFVVLPVVQVDRRCIEASHFSQLCVLLYHESCLSYLSGRITGL